MATDNNTKKRKISLIIKFVIFGSLLIIYTPFYLKSHYKPADIESIPIFWITILQGISCIILVLIILSTYLHHKNNKELSLSKYPHIHSLYSYITIFIVTFVGIIYTIYSDVFYQQGDPLSPIFYGIIGNNTETNLQEIPEKADTTHLVFILDVSKSTKSYKINDQNWVANTKDKIIKSVINSSEIGKKINKFNNDNCNGINLIKLESCSLLETIHTKAKKDNNSFYSVSILTLGKYSDIIQRNIDIKDDISYSDIITKISNLEYSNLQSDYTDYSFMIEKLSEFKIIDGEKNKFHKQEYVITILSDFIHDSGKEKEESNLEILISDLSEKSIFFNLLLLENGFVNYNNKKVNVIPILKNNIDLNLLRTFEISKEDVISYSYYLSDKEIDFIIEKPFHVENKKHTIRIKSDYVRSDSVFFTLLPTDDNRQQFRLNGTPIQVNKKYLLKDTTSTLEFTGHAPNQFSNVTAEFYFQKSKQLISYELVFKKGLPQFISFLLFILALFLVFISLGYIVYLVFQFFGFPPIKTNADTNPPPNTRKEEKLSVNPKINQVSMNNNTIKKNINNSAEKTKKATKKEKI